MESDVMSYFTYQQNQNQNKNNRYKHFWLLKRYALQASLFNILPTSRSGSVCLKATFTPTSKPKLFSFDLKNGEKGITYLGLKHCHNTWTCSHCAPQLSLKRRSELDSVIKIWRADRYAIATNSDSYNKVFGHEVRFVTFTIPHLCSHSLSSLLKNFKNAFRDMTNQWSYKRFLSKFSIIGSVNVLEVTFGKNGWHPHAHVLYFINSQNLNEASFKYRLFKIWFNSAVKHNFSEPSPSAFFVGNGDFVTEYVTKYGRLPKRAWTAGDEMSKWFIKKSNRGFSPFELLEAHLVKKYSEETNAKLDKDFLFEAGERFAEFAEVFKGRHQMQWSRGLKKDFGLKDISDEELITQREQAILRDKSSRELATFSIQEWQNILHEGKRFSLINEHLSRLNINTRTTSS